MTPAPDAVPLVGAIRAAWSDASSGDLRPLSQGSGRARRLEEWTARVTVGTGIPDPPLRTVHWVRQVHGTTVVVVPSEGGDDPEPTDGSPIRGILAGDADALVSAAGGTALAILTADCASIALGSAEGVMGAVHAGWRGLQAGVVQRTVEAMEALGATGVVGALGPCIHPGCYEFSEPDLDQVTTVLGEQVRGRTRAGRPALDVPAAVSAALAAAGARQGAGVDACTGCSTGYFSHRTRGDGGRQALVVWSSAPAGAR